MQFIRQFTTHYAVAALAGLMLTGCTVQPLLTPDQQIGPQERSVLQSVYISPLDSRLGIVLRNELIFLLAGGKAQPATPLYELDLAVSSLSQGAFAVQTSRRDGEPTSSKVTVTASYVLKRASDDVVLGTRTVTATASYDVSQQEFANIRAEKDAEDRAAKEAAERLRGLVAADILRDVNA